MQESRIDDYWNVDGSRDLSNSWTGFTQFTLLSETPPEGYFWSGMEDAPTYSNNPKSECPDLRIRLPRHTWPKSWSNIEDPMVPLDPNLYGHPLAGLLWERHFEVLFGFGWDKSTELGMSVCSTETRTTLAGTRGWHPKRLEEAGYASRVEEIDETCRSWRTNIISWPRKFGMHSTWKQTERNYHWLVQKNVRITNFCCGNRKIQEKPHAKNCRVVLRHGWSCKEVRWKILWVGKQDDSTTLQSICSMHRWPPLQRRRNEICWRIVTSMLSNCSKMFILGTNWKTPIFYGQ